MKQLMRAMAALLLVTSMVSGSFAEDYVIPRDNNGNIPSNINLVGVDVFVATAATAMGSTRPVVLFGYTVSSDAITNHAILRDTSTLNTTSNVKLDLFQDASCGTTSGQGCTTTLPAPVIFRNGISINLGSVVVGTGFTGAQARPRWMFYVRYMDVGGVPGHPPSEVDPAITVDNKGVN